MIPAAHAAYDSDPTTNWEGSSDVTRHSKASRSIRKADSVAVLLATCNGELYLDEQLRSLEAQSVSRVDVYASDDASADRTMQILRHWQRRWQRGRFEIMAGPANGAAQNFRNLICNVPHDAAYFAFCDQDDVWDSDKLAVAENALKAAGEGPALYCSRTRLVDRKGRPKGFSPLFSRPPSFQNAIVQNIGGGNTMVLNPAAFVLLADSARRTPFVMHDWWSYLVVSGAGGEVIYDPEPHLDYRQHGRNQVGKNSGPVAKVRRLQMLVRGRFARWNDANLAGLESCADLLNEDATSTVFAFREIKTARRVAAAEILRRSGIYRQTIAGNASLFIAAMLGKA